ncbi:MAG: IS1595 family transposase [Clostridia bacterium]
MDEEQLSAAAAPPVAGRDYPATWLDFTRFFPDDAACAAYLEQLRWPGGFVCASCGVARQPWRQTRGRLTCAACRRQTSVTAGTVFEKTRTPLRVWFAGAWQVTTAKNGLSAKTLASTLGVRYEDAWSMLHRYRVAMVRAERQSLAGTVEVDETLVGGEEHGGKHGRGVAQAVVVIAIEVHEPKGFGRVRMRHVPDASQQSLVPFVRDVVAPGSLVHTDGWRGYNRLSEHGFLHTKTVLSASPDPAHVVMPGVHRVASLLKRWILGTHQGSVDPAHLQSYLEEFTFRFNRRTSRSRGLVFYRLLQNAVHTAPVPKAAVVHGYLWPSTPES